MEDAALSRSNAQKSLRDIPRETQKRVVVTGGAGFVGSHLVAHLLAKGHQVTVLDDLSAGSRESLPIHRALRFIKGCVLDAPLVRDLTANADLVFHLASCVGMKRVTQDPECSLRVSVEGTRNVLGSIAGPNTPTVLFSSSAVYGMNAAINTSEKLAVPREQALEYDNGIPGYAVGKWEMEADGIERARAGQSILIVRPFNLVGPRQCGAYGMVLPRFLDSALSGKPLTVFGNGKQSRCFGSVITAVESILRLTETPAAWSPENNIVNVGCRDATPIITLAQLVLEETNSRAGIQFIPYQHVYPGRQDVPERVPCLQRLETLIGTMSWPSLRQVIRNILEHAHSPNALPSASHTAPELRDAKWSLTSHATTTSSRQPTHSENTPCGMRQEQRPIAVLGAGLAGLATASLLGDRAVVFEQDQRPGGLVQTLCFDGYWFDRVLHLLYFCDADTEKRVRELMGEILKPCPPQAWVRSQSGVTRYPIQANLRGLPPEVIARCLFDFAEQYFCASTTQPRNFEEMLLRTFGGSLCDEFFFTYNKKMWKRDLKGLAPSGFQWNIARPNLSEALYGAVCPQSEFAPYNGAGWYPRPAEDAPLRGMEWLTRKLADQVVDLRLKHRVVSIDTDKRQIEITGPTDADGLSLQYEERCISTLPLPLMLQLVQDVPKSLQERAAALTWNRVRSVAICIEGPRPTDCGLWQYSSNPSLVFSRLVFMHEFDPLMAPQDGWGLLAEVTEPAEFPRSEKQELIARVLTDVQEAGILPRDAKIIGAHVMEADPAYVVFSVENQPIIEECQAFLRERNIEMLGRYGRWEYSSMAQVMRDAFALAKTPTTLRT